MNLITGLIIFMSGICLTTFGHYADAWIFGYLLSAIFAILTVGCYEIEKGKIHD